MERSDDIIHNMIIPPKSFLLVQNDHSRLCIQDILRSDRWYAYTGDIVDVVIKKAVPTAGYIFILGG